MPEQFDLPRIMRMRNIFGVPQEEQVGATPKPMMDKVPVKEKKPGAFDQFMASINEMPERQNYKPSNWRKVGAGIVGGFRGGAEGAAFREAPFSNAVGDWKLKNDALATAASQERMAENTASSAYARDRANDIRFQDLERKTTEGQARIGIAETNAATARMRAEVYQNLQNGGRIEKNTRTGETFLVTRTGEIKPVPIGTITAQEEQDIKTSGRLTEIGAQGDNARSVANINQAGANARNAATNLTSRQNTADRIAAAMERAKLAAASGGSGNSETQRAQGMLNRASEFIRANPDAADWIQIDENDMVQIVPPDVGGFLGYGARDTQYDKDIINKIRGHIDPDYTGPTGSLIGPSTGSIAPGNTATPAPAPTAIPQTGVNVGSRTNVAPIRTIKIRNKNDPTKTGTMPENRQIPAGWEKY